MKIKNRKYMLQRFSCISFLFKPFWYNKYKNISANSTKVLTKILRCGEYDGTIAWVFFSFSEHLSYRTPANNRKQPSEVCNFIKKETLAEVFFCEFCEIFKISKTLFLQTTSRRLLLNSNFCVQIYLEKGCC